MQHAPAQVVLVTGGSRGVGPDIARLLRSGDADVVVSDDVDDIATRFGRLDTLILTASGDARAVALAALPLMPAGGRIVYVTSHQAHFFPHKAVPKGYTAVAASMRAGETALYAMRSEFQRAGVHLTVVSGDMADGTLAEAAVTAATTPHPTGVVYLGRADYLMTA